MISCTHESILISWGSPNVYEFIRWTQPAWYCVVWRRGRGHTELLIQPQSLSEPSWNWLFCWAHPTEAWLAWGHLSSDSLLSSLNHSWSISALCQGQLTCWDVLTGTYCFQSLPEHCCRPGLGARSCCCRPGMHLPPKRCTFSGFQSSSSGEGD